jgi:hypothetical protein
LPLLVTIIFIFSVPASAEPIIPGDINLNGIPFEMEDALIFADYFVIGLVAFQIDLETQVAATDVNDDGLVLSVADLVYMLRVMWGAVNPPVPPADTIHTYFGQFRYDNTLRLGVQLDAHQGDQVLVHYQRISTELPEISVLPGFDEVTVEYAYTDHNLIILISGLHSVQTNSHYTGIVQFTIEEEQTVQLFAHGGRGFNGELLDMQVREGEFHVGDVNMNDVAFEIADVVLFTNALIYGEEMFAFDHEIQMAASDANGDGSPFTVEDYEFFIGVLTGRINPDDPIGPTFEEQLIVSQSHESISIYSTAENEVGALYLTYLAPNLTDYQVTLSETLANMTLAYDMVDDLLRVLIYGPDNNFIGTSATELVNIAYTGDPPTLLSASSAGFEAEKVDLSVYSRGDVNGDGDINVADVVTIIRIVFGWDAPEPWQMVAMDTNCDGNNDIGEAVYLINYIFKGGPGPFCP